MRVIRVFLSFILMTVLTSNAFAQRTQITFEDFKKFSINNKIGFNNLSRATDTSFVKITQALGTPRTKECNTHLLGTDCTLNYPGIEFVYAETDVGIELSTVDVISQDAFVDYNGAIIKVGDSISKLKSLFPSAYAERYNHTSGGVTRYFISMNVNQSITYVTFRYNPTTRKIIRITMLNILD